jgi:ABC-type nitrate/sulfonate/bicarbonate transport system ATPase subunit
MPAKGADVIETEAPGKEPQSFEERPAAAAAGILVEDVHKAYAQRRGRVTALERLTLSCAPHEVLGVVGPSGCGKSTLLELVAGLEPPTAGTIAVAGALGAAERLARCVLMPQRDLLLPWRSALDNAALPLRFHGLSKAEARRRALPLFERFDLAAFTGARPAELSGGMRQRVSFLRTLMAEKPVLLLDEPFGSLDSITRADMQVWLAGALAQEPRTVLLVSHDVEEALFLCDRVLVLSPRPGRVKAEIPVAIPRPRERRATVTAPEFTALREQALEALA